MELSGDKDKGNSLEKNQLGENRNTTSSDKQGEDEVDLLHLFSVITRSIGNLFNQIKLFFIKFLIYVRNLFKSYKKLIAVLALLGGGIGYLIGNISSQHYETKAVITSKFLTGKNFIGAIEQLNNLVAQGDEWADEQLAKGLNISVVHATSLNEIIAYDKDEYNGLYNMFVESELVSNDSLKLVNYMDQDEFVLVLRAKDASVDLDSLSDGLLAYLEKNSNLTSEFIAEKKSINDQIEQYNNELTELSVLQKVVREAITEEEQQSDLSKLSFRMDKGSSNGRNDISIAIVDKKVEIKELLSELQKSKDLLLPVKYVYSFKNMKLISNTTETRFLLGIIVGVLLGLLYGIVIDANKFLSRKEAEFNS